MWEGRTAHDRVVRVEGLGYGDPSWGWVHKLLVRASLLQAVGRGRGVTRQGVQVVVVSNENLGLPLMAGDMPSIKDPEAETFLAVVKLLSEKMLNIIL